MDYSSKQLKRFFLAAGLRTGLALAVCLGLVFFFVQQIAKEAESLYTERTLSATIDRRQENVEKMAKDLTVVKADIPNMEAVIPDERSLFDVLHIFEAVAKSTGNEATITFGDTSKTESVSSDIPFHFVLTGTMTSLEKFLLGIEGLPYGISILSAQMTGFPDVFDRAEMKVEALVTFRSSSQ